MDVLSMNDVLQRAIPAHQPRNLFYSEDVSLLWWYRLLLSVKDYIKYIFLKYIIFLSVKDI